MVDYYRLRTLEAYACLTFPTRESVDLGCQIGTNLARYDSFISVLLCREQNVMYYSLFIFLVILIYFVFFLFSFQY